MIVLLIVLLNHANQLKLKLGYVYHLLHLADCYVYSNNYSFIYKV